MSCCRCWENCTMILKIKLGKGNKMARGELIGLCDCPECGFSDAEVRPDKSGSPYRFCPECTAQYFTRGAPLKVKNLLAKVRKAASGPAPGGGGGASPAPRPAGGRTGGRQASRPQG